jgi:hypothetical protein
MEATRIAAMVDRLPPKIFSRSNSVVVQQAALDSFYVNVRLLIEFLEVRADKRDASAADTLPGVSPPWTPTLTAAEKTALLGYHDDTSKHVVHFSIQRTHQIQVTKDGIQTIADDVLAVWDQFAIASAHPLVARRADLKKIEM